MTEKNSEPLRLTSVDSSVRNLSSLPGAYLVPYFILLLLVGIPLFFLELAVGQKIRRGSIGVWNYVCPRLGGIGMSSLMVKWIFVSFHCQWSWTVNGFINKVTVNSGRRGRVDCRVTNQSLARGPIMTLRVLCDHRLFTINSLLVRIFITLKIYSAFLSVISPLNLDIFYNCLTLT